VSVLVLEHKTSSEDVGIGSFYWAKLRLDGQISKYINGARALGYEPDGVLYDVLRKPQLKPYQANSKRAASETPKEYRDRIIEDISARPDHYYQRGIVVRLEDEERDAAYDDWQTAEQIREARNANRWPRNVDSCEQYHRKCDYWEVCSGERSIDDPMHYEKTDAHPELTDNGKRHLPLLTTSSSRTFNACHRRYFFAYELQMRPRSTVGARRFGTLIHVALEAWLDAVREPLTGTPLESALTAMYESIKPDERDSYEVAKAEAMLVGYHSRWIDEPLEVLAIEQQFVTALVNPATGASSRTFVLGGKVDGVVRRKDVEGERAACVHQPK
jgi:PD-(D/E)XK nuclease superfamily